MKTDLADAVAERDLQTVVVARLVASNESLSQGLDKQKRELVDVNERCFKLREMNEELVGMLGEYACHVCISCIYVMNVIYVRMSRMYVMYVMYVIFICRVCVNYLYFVHLSNTCYYFYLFFQRKCIRKKVPVKFFCEMYLY